MNYPFNSRSIKRVLVIGASIILVVAALTGCKRVDVPEGTTNGNTPPNLVDDATTLPTPAASTVSSDSTTEAPAPTEETAPAANMAIVKEQVNTLASPSTESKVIVQLDAGDQVEVDRIETLRGVSWAHIPEKGWVNVEYLDMTNVPLANGGNNNSTPANPEATEPNKPTTTTGKGTMGVVTGSDLNIRAEANTTSEIKGKLSYGDRVTILENANGWGKIADGWISLNYVYIDGQAGANQCKGLVIGNQLNVRSGPGTNYDSVTTLNQGTRVQVLEQIKVGNTKWGCTKDGWICMDYLYVDGTTGDGAGQGTVTGDQVNVRSGPGTGYDVVRSVNKGASIKIYAQFKFGDMTWGCTDNGWISMKYVELAED